MGSKTFISTKQMPPMPYSARSIKQQEPIQDRLIAEVEKRKEAREKLKRNLDIEEMKECSFMPKLNDYNLLPRNPQPNKHSFRSQTPIHERVEVI